VGGCKEKGWWTVGIGDASPGTCLLGVERREERAFLALVGEASLNTVLEKRSWTLSMLLTALLGTAGEGAERRDSVSRFIDFVVFRVSVRTGAAVSLLVVRGLGHSQL
jgi:hypothetical protein